MAAQTGRKLYLWGGPPTLLRDQILAYFKKSPSLLEKPVKVPQLVTLPTGEGVRHAAFGPHHGLVVSDSGKVFGMGHNQKGELGEQIKKEAPQRTWVQLEGLPPIKFVACGGSHSLAISEEGDVYGFGWGMSESGKPQKLKFPAGTKIARVSAGARHSFALSEQGLSFAWGSNDNIALGNDGGMQSAPVEIEALSRTHVVHISAGASFGAAVTKDGLVYTWGKDHMAQLGHGQKASVGGTVSVEGPSELLADGDKPLTNAAQVSCGHRHALCVLKDGTVRQWGTLLQRNDYATPPPTPSELPAGVRVVRIGAGSGYSLALTEDGRVFSWGQPMLGKSLIKSPEDTRYFGPSGKLGKAVDVFAGMRTIGVLAE